MKVLILGDCQSNGNNCLAHEILNDQEGLQTWSLRYHNKLEKVFKWMLKDLKKNQLTLEHEQTKDLKIFVWNYLKQQEKKISWPSYLNYEVINHSYNGAHFSGYLKRLNSYLKTNRPDIILITDYHIEHRFVSFKYKNERYFFEKSDHSELNWDFSKYPKEVYDIFLKRMEYQSTKNINWHIKRHEKSYNILIKKIKSFNLPYLTIKFGSDKEMSFDNFMDIDIDCYDLRELYSTENGEHSFKKRNLQEKIKMRIDNYVRNSFIVSN